MITEAINKITMEVNSIKGDHAQNIGEYLIDHITEESAEKIMAAGKTLSGCISSITSKAKAKATGGCAMIIDTEVYSWVREYYGIESIPAATQNSYPDAPNDLNVSLFDLM